MVHDALVKCGLLSQYGYRHSLSDAAAWRNQRCQTTSSYLHVPRGLPFYPWGPVPHTRGRAWGHGTPESAHPSPGWGQAPRKSHRV